MKMVFLDIFVGTTISNFKDELYSRDRKRGFFKRVTETHLPDSLASVGMWKFGDLWMMMKI